MWKKFLNGLVIGTGFAVALIIIFVVFVGYGLPWYLNNKNEYSEEVIKQVPSVSIEKPYLGSTASTSGDFDYDSKVLVGGDARIIGTISSTTNNPEGLRLRLALNGKAWSQWAVVDGDGNYSISVPAGEYVVNGFELDKSSADITLPNNILHPAIYSYYSEFTLDEKGEAHGIDLNFVEPVVKQSNKVQYTLGEDVTIKWNDFPDADYYKVQIYQKESSNTWQSKELIDWKHRPQTNIAELNLKQHSIGLIQGKFYFFEVKAFDADGNILSESIRDHLGYDFSIK